MHQNIEDSKVLFYTLSAHLLLRTSLNDHAPPFFLYSYLFYLASAGIAEVLICKASSDWLKFCLLLSFWYLRL